MVYYYGWDRLDAKTHLRVGWIYFASAWASLVVIAGILAFMLTSGDWVRTRGFADGYFNPTYLPMVALRTAVAVGLAGLYALFAALVPEGRGPQGEGRALVGHALDRARRGPRRRSRSCGTSRPRPAPASRSPRRWARSRPRPPPCSPPSSARSSAGQPIVRGAARVAVGGTALLVVASLALVALRARRYGRLEAGLLMALGLVSMGGSEWVREGLRKPWVIDRHMFVNGVRVPGPAGTPAGGRPVRARRAGPARGPRDLALGGGARRLPSGRPRLRADCRSPSGPRSRWRPAARSSGSSARPATPSAATSASGGWSGARASPRSRRSSTRRRSR